ncbi:MAG: hypothetical protein K2N95_02645 [Lachnospiraceae bacterium]|nr:hypothetical protein [Lachnospiraceae bacterium]
MLRRKMKKMLSTAILSAMTFMMVGSIQVHANNWKDRPFSFVFNGTQNYTEAEQKTDTSKLYMKCESITSGTSYTAHAIGYDPATGRNVDCSRGYSYVFNKPGQSYYMTSWVYENGYRQAKIAASPNYGYSFSASGQWSPDNVRGI